LRQAEAVEIVIWYWDGNNIDSL